MAIVWDELTGLTYHRLGRIGRFRYINIVEFNIQYNVIIMYVVRSDVWRILASCYIVMCLDEAGIEDFARM